MADFRIRVVVDSSQADRGIANVNNRLGQTERRSGDVGRALNRAFAGVSVILLVRQLITLSDTYTNLQNRLAVVTDGTMGLAVAQQSVFDIAQSTRAPLREIGALYSRTAAAADSLGASQEDVERATRLAAQSIAVQGSSTAEAQGALLQFSQLLGGSVVQAQEFNSIIDGARPILVAVSNGLIEAGGSVDTLRQLVREGRVTSEVFFQAFLAGSTEIAGQFDKTSATIGQGFDVIRNSLIFAVGDFNEATGASTSFANALIDLSGLIDSGIVQSNLIATLELWQSTIDDVTSGVSGLENEFLFLEDVANGSINVISNGLLTLPTTIVTVTQVLTVETLSLFDRVSTRVGTFFDELKRARERFTAEGGVNPIDLDQVVADAKEAADIQVQALLDVRLATLDGIFAADDARRKSFEERRAQLQREADLLREIRAEGRATDDDEERDPVSLGDDPGLVRLITRLKAEAEAQRESSETRADALRLVRTERQLKRDLVGEEEELVLGLISEIRVQKELNQVLEDIQGPQQELSDRQAALNQLFAEGQLTANQFSNAIRAIGVSQAELNIESGEGTLVDGFLLQLQTMLEAVENFESEAGALFGQFTENAVGGFSEAAANAIVFGEDFEESVGKVARQAVADLVAGLIQMGIQFVVNAAIGQTLGAAATTAAVAEAAAISSAFATPAALVSLASFGSNSVPAAAGITSTVALSNGLAAVPGFATGGSMMVGGTGGTDSQRVMFDATPNERITIETPQQRIANDRQNSQQSSSPNISIINVRSDEDIAEYLSSPEGTEIILNVMTENRDTIDRL